jgi:hypothetical protein
VAFGKLEVMSWAVTAEYRYDGIVCRMKLKAMSGNPGEGSGNAAESKFVDRYRPTRLLSKFQRLLSSQEGAPMTRLCG